MSSSATQMPAGTRLPWVGRVRHLLEDIGYAATLTLIAVVASASETPAATTRTSGIDVRHFDRSVRPQDDFYRFANGGWLDSVDIPSDRERVSPSSQINDIVLERLRGLIERVETSPSEYSADARKIAALYASFMDEPGLQSPGLRPLKKTLARIDAATAPSEITLLIGQLGQMWVTTPVVNSVLNDARNPNAYALYLYQGGLGLPNRDYYLSNSADFEQTRKAYEAHVRRMFHLAGDAASAVHAKQVLDLEMNLALAHWSAADSRDLLKTNNPAAVADLPKLAPGLDWNAYLTGAGVGTRATTVVLAQPSFFIALGRLIKNTPLPVWKSYLRFHLLSAFAPYLDQAFVDEGFAFDGTLVRGLRQNMPRWKRGLDLIEDTMGEGLGRLYVAEYFPPESKARVDAMAKNLIAALRADIDTLAWMGPETKARAKRKLDRLRVKIGYPESWRNYDALVIAGGDLIGNVMRARTFEYQRNIRKLGTPVDHDEWYITPQTIDAYQFPPENVIVFPAGLMQPPFFDGAADDAANYGAIGSSIGHELSHGFDDQGSLYDENGTLLGKPGWFTQGDRERFDTLTRALVNQYGAIEAIRGYRINGELTLGENIADNSGLAMAFKAYRLSLGGVPAPVIDGLTGDQRFFLSWTQKWRAKVRDRETIRLLKSDEHSPRWVRGVVPLQNQDAFFEAFDIREGDRMFVPPQKRVRIW